MAPCNRVTRACAACKHTSSCHTCCAVICNDLQKVREPFYISLCAAIVQDLPVVVDDDFDEGLPAEAGSECEEEAPGPSTAGAAAAAAAEPEQDTAEESCACCGEAAKARWIGCACGARCHLECLAEHYMQARCLAGLGPCMR